MTQSPGSLGKSGPARQLRFYLTAPGPCPYLPGQQERKVFTALEVAESISLNNALTHAGFRRSQNIAYRPACEGCDACVSVRIPVSAFEFPRKWAKIINRNKDLVASLKPARATEEHYSLLRTYLDARHAEGGMADMTPFDFVGMVEESTVRTGVVEYRNRDDGRLTAAALIDILGDGISLVYSFFDPDLVQRSLGSFVILDAVRRAQSAGLAYVYLGYWVRGSEKMAYKARFKPLEVLAPGGWIDLAVWEEMRGLR